MVSENMQENDKLEREHKRLETNMSIGKTEGIPANEIKTRRLRTRTIVVSPQVIPPISSSVP